MKLASACAIIRKMFKTTGILSKDARTSPQVAAGSIRGSLAIRLFLTLLFLLAAAEPSAQGQTYCCRSSVCQHDLAEMLVARHVFESLGSFFQRQHPVDRQPQRALR